MRLATALCASVVTASLVGPTLAAPNVSLDPKAIGKAPIDDWTTFNGDYSGQRYSTLTQIGPANVNQLGQRWIYLITGAGTPRCAPIPVIL